MDRENNKYDAWLHWDLLKKCNLNCVYCFDAETNREAARIPNIDIRSLISTLEKTDKIFKIFFTGGGEPLLVPNLIEACVKITQKHFIALTTNLTSMKIKEFAEKINPGKVTHIIGSAHIKELERKQLLNTYVDHFLLLKEKGFNIKAVAVAYPPLIKAARRYKQFFSKKGISLGFRQFIGEYKGKRYPDSYTEHERETFGLDNNINFHQHKRICTAGYNVASVNPKGDIHVCQFVKSKIGNIYKKIELKNNLMLCPLKFCSCPFNEYDPHLLERAIKECGGKAKEINPYEFYSALIYEKIDRSIGMGGAYLQNNYPKLYSIVKKENDKSFGHYPGIQ